MNSAVRAAVTAAHTLLKAFWFLSRPKTFGAHAVALTPDGKLILVKLRYAPGWRVPGGGRSEHEDPAAAALRELREEIGMISHGEVRPAHDFEEPTNFKRDTASLVIVRDVIYRPARWNWEVERICEADPASLPADMSPMSERWIEAARPML
ncbi:MAG TPA: NUDIX domain-containing protein [Sphingomicrobium sp.]|nr:NUDIX domain-containing protein [Sphingomicrobium sp.]